MLGMLEVAVSGMVIVIVPAAADTMVMPLAGLLNDTTASTSASSVFHLALNDKELPVRFTTVPFSLTVPLTTESVAR